MSEPMVSRREYLNGELSFVIVTVYTFGGYTLDCLRCGAHLQQVDSLRKHDCCVKAVVCSPGTGKKINWTQYVPDVVNTVFIFYCLSVFCI